MTARLRPDKDLTALLCRYVYGESPGKLAEAYGLKRLQVVRLLGTHRDTLKNMKAFLGLPRRLPAKPGPKSKKAPGLWRKCNRCRADFWTESQFIRTCEGCKNSADWKSGGSDFTTSGVRGLG